MAVEALAQSALAVRQAQQTLHSLERELRASAGGTSTAAPRRAADALRAHVLSLELHAARLEAEARLCRPPRAPPPPPPPPSRPAAPPARVRAPAASREAAEARREAAEARGEAAAAAARASRLEKAVVAARGVARASVARAAAAEAAAAAGAAAAEAARVELRERVGVEVTAQMAAEAAARRAEEAREAAAAAAAELREALRAQCMLIEAIGEMRRDGELGAEEERRVEAAVVRCEAEVRRGAAAAGGGAAAAGAWLAEVGVERLVVAALLRRLHRRSADVRLEEPFLAELRAMGSAKLIETLLREGPLLAQIAEGVLAAKPSARGAAAPLALGVEGGSTGGGAFLLAAEATPPPQEEPCPPLRQTRGVHERQGGRKSTLSVARAPGELWRITDEVPCPTEPFGREATHPVRLHPPHQWQGSFDHEHSAPMGLGPQEPRNALIHGF